MQTVQRCKVCKVAQLALSAEEGASRALAESRAQSKSDRIKAGLFRNAKLMKSGVLNKEVASWHRGSKTDQL